MLDTECREKGCCPGDRMTLRWETAKAGVVFVKGKYVKNNENQVRHLVREKGVINMEREVILEWNDSY